MMMPSIAIVHECQIYIKYATFYLECSHLVKCHLQVASGCICKDYPVKLLICQKLPMERNYERLIEHYLKLNVKVTNIN